MDSNELIKCACGCERERLRYDKQGEEREYISGHNQKGKCKHNTNLKVFCLCGCGQILSKFDNKGREKKYKNGHINKNKSHSISWREKQSKSMKGQHTYPSKIIKCKTCEIEVVSNSPNRIYCDFCSHVKKELRKKEYLTKYKDKRYNYIKRRMNTDIEFRIANRLRNYLRKVLYNYTQTGKIRKSREYGIDYKAIIQYLKPFPEDFSNYEIDHIKPLCSFDLTNTDEIKQAFAPENHQWLTIKENRSKGGKWNNE